MTSRTTVYTDGACSGNPGPGGWAWVVPDGPYGNGSEDPTTNQRMEVTAALEAIRTLTGPLHIISDSTYVVNCFRDSWWRGWLKRGWKNSAKKPVANRDLWEPLIELYQQRDITFEWVKGHAGNEWNERADELAVEARDSKISNGKTTAGDTTTTSTGAPAGDTATAGDTAAGATTSTTSIPAVSATVSSQDAVDGGSESSVSTPSADGGAGAVKIVVTGVRPPDMGGYHSNRTTDALRDKLSEILKAKSTLAALEDNEIRIYTSLGLGAETLAAQIAVDLGLDFVAVLPFPNPSARWPKESQKQYESLIAQAAEVVTVTQKSPTDTSSAAKAFSKRDRWMAKHISEAIVIHNPNSKFSSRTVTDYEKAFAENLWIIEVEEH